LFAFFRRTKKKTPKIKTKNPQPSNNKAAETPK